MKKCKTCNVKWKMEAKWVPEKRSAARRGETNSTPPFFILHCMFYIFHCSCFEKFPP